MSKETMVYIGPTLDRIVGTAFRNGYPPKIRQVIREAPWLTDLFVSASQLAEVKKEIRNQGSSLNQLYRYAESRG